MGVDEVLGEGGGPVAGGVPEAVGLDGCFFGLVFGWLASLSGEGWGFRTHVTGG